MSWCTGGRRPTPPALSMAWPEYRQVSMEFARKPQEHIAAAVEVALVAVLVIVLALQLVGYPASDESDPEGYVSYATYLNETGKLQPDSPRLPGYPAFLALVSKLTGPPLGLRVYWVQSVLLVAAALIGWGVTRRL